MCITYKIIIKKKFEYKVNKTNTKYGNSNEKYLFCPEYC